MISRRFAPTLRVAHLWTATVALVAIACSADKILEVEDIDVAQPPAIQGPTALPSLLAGAIGDFGTAYNGGVQSTGLALDLNQVSIAGLISDEFINTETFPTRIEVDQRQQQYQSNGSLRDAYYAIQQARASADKANESFIEFGPTDVGRAEVLNLGALSLILMAENYCGAIPISKETSPGVFEYGSALSTTQIFERALAKADSALAHARAAATTGTAAAKTAQERLARIVRARALLNLNRPAEAGANLGESEVPTTYQYFFKHSEVTARQNNGTWLTTASVARFGVPDREGTNGLPFRSEGDAVNASNDPRVASTRRTGAGVGFDGVTPQWIQTKHGKRDSLAIIADGVEARLIQAEAALRAGNYATTTPATACIAITHRGTCITRLHDGRRADGAQWSRLHSGPRQRVGGARDYRILTLGLPDVAERAIEVRVVVLRLGYG